MPFFTGREAPHHLVHGSRDAAAGAGRDDHPSLPVRRIVLADEAPLRSVSDGYHALLEILTGGLTGVDAGLDSDDEGASRPAHVGGHHQHLELVPVESLAKQMLPQHFLAVYPRHHLVDV